MMKREMQKIKLNTEMVNLAAIYLTKDDFEEIARITGMAVSTIYRAARGQITAWPHIIDMIQKTVCARHKLAAEELKNFCVD